MHTLYIVCVFTFAMSLTDTLAYCMRLSGIRTRQIAIAMSFVTSTLLVSRLSNLFQAPLLGAMVDHTILVTDLNKLELLESQFRWVIFAAFLAVVVGMFFTPTMVNVFGRAIERYKQDGSMVKLMFKAVNPLSIPKWLRMFRFPYPRRLSGISLRNIPKTFLVLNVLVTSIHGIGVLCALLASAYLPELRATALMLSGIVNGLATILLTLFVDPSAARVLDQAVHDTRSSADVKSVLFFLQLGRAFGLLIVAQLTLMLFTHYVIWVTKWISTWAM